MPVSSTDGFLAGEGLAGGGAGGSGLASAARTPGLGGGAIDGEWLVGLASPSLRSGLWASGMRVVVDPGPGVMRRSARPAPPAPPGVGTAHTHCFWAVWRLGVVLGRGVTPAPLDLGGRRSGGCCWWGIPDYSRTHSPEARMASGARSAPVGQATALGSTRICNITYPSRSPITSEMYSTSQASTSEWDSNTLRI